jgi:hypothetical protein
MSLCALLLLVGECFYFFKNETNLTRTVTNTRELCGAGATVEYGFSGATDNRGDSLGVYACLSRN